MSGEGDHVTFPWKSPPWDFAKPDNSAGNVGDRLGKKIACSSSHAQAAAEKEVDPAPTRKRSCDKVGGEDKSGKGELAASEGKAVGESDHDIHIWTERERRKKMRDMFANLHALLPHIPSKVADKSSIVDEAVNHIKKLEDTLQNLQKQKNEKYHCTAVFNCDPSTAANSQSLVCDSREAFLASQGSASNLPISASSSSASSPVFRHPIAFQTWSSPNVVLNICGDEAMISVCSQKKPGLFTAICYVLEKHKIQVISAQMSSDYSRSLYMIQAQVAGASDQHAKVLSVEEIYKQAATEIMVWATS